MYILSSQISWLSTQVQTKGCRQVQSFHVRGGSFGPKNGLLSVNQFVGGGRCSFGDGRQCLHPLTDAQRKLTHKEFRRSLVLALCEEQCSANTHQPARWRDQTLERLRGSHFPDTAATRRDCRVCSVHDAGGQRRRTNTICADCSDHGIAFSGITPEFCRTHLVTLTLWLTMLYYHNTIPCDTRNWCLNTTHTTCFAHRAWLSIYMYMPTCTTFMWSWYNMVMVQIHPK